MTSVKIRKSPVEQILHETLKKIEENEAFGEEVIEHLTQLFSSSGVTKSPKIIEAIKIEEQTEDETN